MASKRVLIVGGVAGGASCAARLRRLDEDAEIFIYERGPDVSFANCGLPYYIGGVIRGRQQLLVASPERFRDSFRIEVRARNDVQAIDCQAKTVAIRNVRTGAMSTDRYDALVLAPGAAPVRPPLPGIDLPGVFTLRNLEDADGIRSWIDQRDVTRAVIVGGGYIGLEMAENLQKRKLDVTLLEATEQLMPALDPEMATPLADALRRHGVEVRLGAPVTAIEEGADGTLQVIAAGTRYRAGAVILAVGVRPDVALARQAGLTIGECGGIRVDEQMRTSDPNVYAVGDAAEVRDAVTGEWTLIPLAGPANRQGRVAADAICGRPARFRGSQGTAVVGVCDLSAAVTGASEKTLSRCGRPYARSYIHSLHHAGYYPGAEPISMKTLFEPDTGRILGAQAVGRDGVEKRIDVMAMAIQKKATIWDLEEAELCYAPQYGSAKDPVNIAGFVAANTLRGDVEVVFWDEYHRRLAAGEPLPTIVDVRSNARVAATGIPGALRIPLGELRARLGELPRDEEIWLHCNVGQTSYLACRLLTQHGYRVRNLAGGIASFAQWPKPPGNGGAPAEAG